MSASKIILHISTFIYAVCALVYGCRPGSDHSETDGFHPDEDVQYVRTDVDNRVDSIVNLCTQASSMGDVDATARYAKTLLEIGEKEDSDYARMYGNLYTGQSYLVTNDCDSVLFFLERARELGERLQVGRVLSSVNNAIGIYYIDVVMDYHKGLSYFLDALNIAKTDPHERSYPIILMNLATTYYMRNDPAGLKYALEVYQIGHDTDDEFIIFGGAGVCACMYYLLEDYEKAEEYIVEILPIVAKYNNESAIYSLYGNVLSNLGKYSKAEYYYEESIKYIDSGRVPSAVMAYLNYGIYLIDKGKNGEAIELLKEGIDLSISKNNAAHRYLLYENLAQAYSNLGLYEEALRNHRIYHSEAETIFNVERERSTNELRLKYEAERQENELRQNKIELMQQQRQRQVIVLILFFILACFVVTYILYRRKNRMYLQIARQHHEFMRKEKLRENMNKVREPDEDNEHENDEKQEELFRRAEHLMQVEQIYREHDLSSEKLADKLGTNRTYLSRTINVQASMTFSAYVNSYRINEAVKLLSDPDIDIPLKAMSQELGFKHIQTFYTVFNNTTGMPPLKFREKILQLQREQKKYLDDIT